MAIVHKFDITEQDYFDYALNYFNDQRLFDSLEMVGRCLDIDPDGFDFGMLRARILYEMELFDDALKQYYNLFLRYTAIPELYLGMVQVFGALGDMQKAFYFLESLLKMELDEEEAEYLNSLKEFDFKKLEEFRNMATSKLRLVEPGQEEYEKAQKYIREAKFKEASEYLEAIPEESKHYSRSLVDRAIVDMGGGKYDKALVLINKALLRDPDNIHTLLTKSMCYYLIGNSVGFDASVKAIEQLNMTTLEHLHLALSFGIEMKIHLWVVKYGTAILEQKPYHKGTIKYLMQAYYNLGEYDLSREMLSLLLKTDHNDYVIKYYSIIINDRKKENLEYSQSLQSDDIKTVSTIIGPALIKAADFREALSENGGELFLEWYFSQNYTKNKHKIASKLDADFTYFIRMQLLSENLTFRDRLALLRRLLNLEKPRYRDFAVIICGNICEFDPRPPKYIEQSPKLISLYLDLYATLSLFNEINDAKFNRFFKLLAGTSQFKLPTKHQTPAFLAGFYFKYLGINDQISFEDTCKLFDTTPSKVYNQLENLEILGAFKY